MNQVEQNVGIVSYNIYCNFTNYGSALQSWALSQAVSTLGGNVKLVDYCPGILADKDPLNPFGNMWDKDEESVRMCKLTMPAIRINYEKFMHFYNERFIKTKRKYTSVNFNEITDDEQINGFICGSDTIFCPDEFGIDDGYYANYDCMRRKSVAYAASFGDPHFTDETYLILNERLKNFKAFGLRENLMIPYVSEHTDVPVQKVLDPTLLLTSDDYDTIAEERLVSEKYMLLYARRYNPTMNEYAEKLAEQNSWKIVDISLRATNAEMGHRMYYEAGVEEFLSLVKHSEYVVTNSFHGMIFSVQYKRPFVVFSREQCDTKITELLELFGLTDRMLIKGTESFRNDIDYDAIHKNIATARKGSLQFLSSELDLIRGE